MSDNDSARRVVLLARPGPARERMREALAQAAAVVVLEADPTATDPAEVAAARPDVALIVLDAATDEALDRFDALLSDPSVEVLFEEAELAVGRAGWDAARWVRHLAAKLHRSGDVLPPGSGPADTDKPAAMATPPSGAAAPASEPPVAPVVPVATPDGSLSAIPDLPDLPDLPLAGEAATTAGATDLAMPALESTAFDLAAPADPTPVPPELPPLELPEPAQPSPGFQSTFDIHGDMAVQETGEISLAPLQLDEEFLTTSSGSIAPLEGLELPGADAAFDIAGVDGVRTEPSSLPGSRFELELLDDSPSELSLEGVGGGDSPADASQFSNDLADLHSRIASMELVIDRPSSQVLGAVLVLAGIGGPDAVRQLLGALPSNFPRAVLVQQRLDGGHYDKLVAQMQRATQLLVELAVPGRPLQPSSVYILSPAIGVEPGPSGLVFTDEPGDLLASLPASDSAVLMLSGSDPNQVEAVMKLSVGGALVAAQALDGCYDVAAPAALASRGGNVAKPQDLARRLAERWVA